MGSWRWFPDCWNPTSSKDWNFCKPSHTEYMSTRQGSYEVLPHEQPNTWSLQGFSIILPHVWLINLLFHPDILVWRKKNIKNTFKAMSKLDKIQIHCVCLVHKCSFSLEANSCSGHRSARQPRHHTPPPPNTHTLPYFCCFPSLSVLLPLSEFLSY